MRIIKDKKAYLETLQTRSTESLLAKKSYTTRHFDRNRNEGAWVLYVINTELARRAKIYHSLAKC